VNGLAENGWIEVADPGNMFGTAGECRHGRKKQENHDGEEEPEIAERTAGSNGIALDERNEDRHESLQRRRIPQAGHQRRVVRLRKF
jgi:hypothetical protein